MAVGQLLFRWAKLVDAVLFWLAYLIYGNISTIRHLKLQKVQSFKLKSVWKFFSVMLNVIQCINPLMPGGNKRSHMLKTNSQRTAAGLFQYVWLFVTTKH